MPESRCICLGTYGFTAYLLSNSPDVPAITPVIVAGKEPTGPFGAQEVGEPVLLQTTAAKVNAVYNASGVSHLLAAVTPDRY